MGASRCAFGDARFVGCQEISHFSAAAPISGTRVESPVQFNITPHLTEELEFGIIYLVTQTRKRSHSKSVEE